MSYYFLHVLVFFVFVPACVVLLSLVLSKNENIKNLKYENRELLKEIKELEQRNAESIVKIEATPAQADDQNTKQANELESIRRKCESQLIPANNWSEVSNILESYINIAPNDSFGWFYMACALHQLKQTDEAIKMLQYAVNNLKDDTRMHLARIKLACFEHSKGNVNQAKDWLMDAKRAGGVGFVRYHTDNETELSDLRAWVRFI